MRDQLENRRAPGWTQHNEYETKMKETKHSNANKSGHNKQTSDKQTNAQFQPHIFDLAAVAWK